MNQIRELFGLDCKELKSSNDPKPALSLAFEKQTCPYTEKPCTKARKADPARKSGICSVEYQSQSIIICPNRFLERKTIFQDCLQLLDTHQQENKLYLLPEVSIPGGQLDFVLVSACEGAVEDLAGIEIQSVDTTGTLWAARQAFLQEAGFEVDPSELKAARPFGINWKMSLKTILVQMLHKAQLFEAMQKPLILILQKPLLEKLKRAFNFQGLSAGREYGLIYLFSYSLSEQTQGLRLVLEDRIRTSSQGLKACLEYGRDKELTLNQFRETLSQKLVPDLQLDL